MRITAMILWSLFLLGLAPALQAQNLKTPEAVLEANIEATGGADAWSKIKSLRMEGAMAIDSPVTGARKGAFVMHVKLPGYSHREVTMDGPMGEMVSTIVNTPEASWVASSRGGQRPLPERTWVDMEAAKAELGLLENDAYKLASLETEIGDAGPIYIITVEYDGKTYKRHYDQLSLMLVAAERPSPQGSKDWIYYEDYREVEGLKIAHAWTSQGRVVVNQGGSPQESIIETNSTLEKVVFNAPVDTALFDQ